jgi:hypothetical protein
MRRTTHGRTIRPTPHLQAALAKGLLVLGKGRYGAPRTFSAGSGSNWSEIIFILKLKVGSILFMVQIFPTKMCQKHYNALLKNHGLNQHISSQFYHNALQSISL